ncbi:MAG: FtsQ-type POTRA domain-containing protein [Actinomycetota bacterium]
MSAAATTLLRALSISAFVAILTAATVFTLTYLTMPVTGIEIKGARMLPESAVWNAVPDRASLMTLNVEALEKQLESNPWVKGAEVSRDWSSGIVTVKVEERRAVLHVELDGRRAVLAVDGTELPGLGGADLELVELDERRLEEILAALRTFEESGVALKSVDAVGPGGVEATVKGRKVIFSGTVSEAQARALDGVMRRHPDERVFDLRSPERIVVSGRPGVGDEPGG